MKYLLFLLLAWGAVATANAQNLVPNPSFEQMANCPPAMSAPQDPPGPSATVQDWFKAGLGSTDFYNACSNGNNDVPANQKGWQQARTGQGYAGFYAVYEGSMASREYAQCQLLQPLIAGHRYRVSFWVSLADSNANGLKASDQVAAYFSNAYIVVNTSQITGVTPQVQQPAGSFLNNSTGWVEVSDTFIANGGERHMIIGVFVPFAAQTYQVIDGPSQFYQIYYYLDDVCVLDLSETSLIEVHDTAVCAGATSMTLSARPGMSGYEWSNGATTQQTTVSAAGIYWVRSYGECELRVDTFHVGMFTDSGHVALGPDTLLCYGDTLMLDIYNPGYTAYAWNTGAVTPRIDIAVSGTYAVTVTSGCGVFTDSIAVTVKEPVPPLSPLDTLLCGGAPGSFSLPVWGTGVRWYDHASGLVWNEQPPIDRDREQEYDYYVTQTIDGCESGERRIHVRVQVPPSGMLHDTALCEGRPLWLGSDMGNNIMYQWDNGSDSCCIRVNRSGSYRVRLSNACGLFYDSAQVAILDDCDHCIWLPGAFSPNADGLNDLFDVKANCPVRGYLIHIYNRYGQRIFSSSDLHQSWDGTFRNTSCDAGVYYYYLQATPAVGGGKLLVRKGEVTLVR